MTVGRCRACEHPDRGGIDAALAGGQSPRTIVRRYRDVSRPEIRRHRDECLAHRRDVRRWQAQGENPNERINA